jgi:transposase InsO family protein
LKISRQAVYRGRRRRKVRQIEQEAVVELEKRERCVQPRLGCRKIRVVLRKDLGEMGIRVGRDRLFKLLRQQGLLVERKRRGVRTTDSRHGFRTYGNLLKERVLTGPHQGWVSDLTYVRSEEGFVYVLLISDAWSRKIVGYASWGTLESAGSVKALEQALRQLPAGSRPLHHSDRGVQYACWEYVERLEKGGLEISMTEENHCYENAQAERLNGILKQEYGLGETFGIREQVGSALAQAVSLYNGRRPHTSLGYLTPEAVHGAVPERAA